MKLGDGYDNLTDTAETRPHKMADMLDKCRRAVAMARAEAAGDPVMARAVERVEALAAASS